MIKIECLMSSLGDMTLWRERGTGRAFHGVTSSQNGCRVLAVVLVSCVPICRITVLSL